MADHTPRLQSTRQKEFPFYRQMYNFEHTHRHTQEKAKQVFSRILGQFLKDIL